MLFVDLKFQEKNYINRRNIFGCTFTY